MKVTYNKQLTAPLVIDPDNDFISEGGKLCVNVTTTEIVDSISSL